MKEKEKSYDSLEVNTNKNLLCEYRMDFSFNMKRKKNFNGKNFALCIAGDLKVFQGFGEERIQKLYYDKWTAYIRFVHMFLLWTRKRKIY